MRKPRTVVLFGKPYCWVLNDRGRWSLIRLDKDAIRDLLPTSDPS